MKIKQKIVGLALIAASLTSIGHAQTNESVVNWEADIAGLSALSSGDIPKSGTFWLVTPPNGNNGGMLPPYPCLPTDFDAGNIYTLPSGAFLVDATGGNDGTDSLQLAAQILSVSNIIQQSETVATSQAMGMHAMDLSGPPSFNDTNGDGYTPDDLTNTPIAIDYGTNLWIAQWNLTTNSVTGIASNTVADISYELMTNSDLTTTNWGHTGQFILGSEVTNWTALNPFPVSQTNNLFFQLLSYVSSGDGSGLPLWWEEEYFGTNFVDAYGDPEGDGYSNLYKYQNGMNPNVFYQPAAPQGLTATYNAVTGTANISWLPSPGNVTGYTLTLPGDNPDVYPNTITVTLSTGTTSYADTDPTLASELAQAASYDPFSLNPSFATFDLVADYTPGPSASASTSILANQPDIWLVQGAQGSNFLAAAISALPPNSAAIQLIRYDWSAAWNNNNPTSNNIPLTSFTNGLFYLSPAMLATPDDGNDDDFWGVQTVDSNGVATSQVSNLGFTSGAGNSPIWNDNINDRPLNPPFLDGRVQMKQNVVFQMRAATQGGPFSYWVTDGYSFTADDIYPTNYAYSGFYLPANLQFYSGYAPFPGGIYDIYQPFENNYYYRNFVYDPANINEGALTTGIYYPNTGDLTILNTTAYQFQSPVANGTTIAALLDASDTDWLATGDYHYNSYSFTFDTNADAYTDGIGISLGNENSYNYFNSGVSNYFGLPFLSAKLTCPSGSGTATITLYPGNNTTNGSFYYYAQPAQPELQTVEYDFWNDSTGFEDEYGNWNTTDILPGEAGFSVTNQTDNTMIVGLGNSIQIAGYAKMSVQNGSPGVYGYVGQYFADAYVIDTNGTVTANPAGVLSPYGVFFPMQPGPAALVTMPDPDTGQQGTGIVNCVSLNVDKNHDGTMDLSLSGADVTSQSSPFRFWVNNRFYSGLGMQMAGNGVPPTYSYGYITSPSDLENFGRLWICGMPALTNGYQVTLSWANVSSGNPVVNLYSSVETNGGIGYLTDTNIAAEQATVVHDIYYFSKTGAGVAIATITNGMNFTFPASYFTNSGNKYLLFEGAGIGAGELMLTVTDANGNQIAQTGVWLDLHDVQDFYELAQATNVTSSLPPSDLVSQLQVVRQVPTALDETPQLVVFVHGINNTDSGAQDSTEKICKRLYWSGYHGRVAEFKWPCAFLPSYNTLNPFSYDLGEFFAWKSAAALVDYLTYLRNRPDLAGYDIDILAHSQGNIVASEAVRLGAPFDNYILTQGAAPAHSYDTTVPFLSNLVAADTSTPTPFYPTNGGYNGYFSGITGNLINFFNTNDFALASGVIAGQQANWVADQQTQKPEDYYYRLGQTYNYNPYTFTATATLLFTPRTVTDPYELMSQVARARSSAVGAQENVSGVINTNSAVDLLKNFQFGFTREEHSAEFTRPIQTSILYYQQVLRSLNITVPQ